MISHAKDHPRVNADVAELFELSYSLSLLARRQMQDSLAAFSLTPPQYSAMRCILGHDNSISISRLAEEAHQVTPTMTGIINRLEERGYVIRQRSAADRRNQFVSLTPAGRELLGSVSRLLHDKIRMLLASIDPEEREVLLRVARRLVSRGVSGSPPSNSTEESSLD